MVELMGGYREGRKTLEFWGGQEDAAEYDGIVLPNGNRVGVVAAEMLREFGVEVGGGPEPWAAAEAELAAAVASGRIRSYAHHSFNVGGHFYMVDRGSKYDQYECSGETREAAATDAVAWLANFPAPQPAPAGMSDQAVRDELWTLGWRDEAVCWKHPRYGMVAPVNAKGMRHLLVEARRLAAEEKAGGQG